MALSGIGDTLIATPLLRELRVSYPKAVLDAFVLWKGSKDLLEGNPRLDSIRQKNLILAGYIKSLPFLLGLRRRRYDVSINVHTQGRIHYRLVARLIGARLRLSHTYENHGWLDRLLVNRTLPQDYSVHSVENNHRLLALLGGPGVSNMSPTSPARPSPVPCGEREKGSGAFASSQFTPPRPTDGEHEADPSYELILTKEEEAWASGLIADHSISERQRLGIHVGSGGTKNLALKRWPLEHYIELLKRLATSHPSLSVLLFGGPEEQPDHARILRDLPHPNILAPETRNLRQAAALLKHCHAFLSVDTALMHLAAAMKVPGQIVIEAPTLNATNVPWRNPYRLVRNPAIGGRNLDYYRYDGKPIKGTAEELRRIMASITVAEVHAAVVETLRQG